MMPACARSPCSSTIFRGVLSVLKNASISAVAWRGRARAEGAWLRATVGQHPRSWRDVEWWICPSYYSEDGLLERVFGKFEREFLEKLAETLPPSVACMWTGPKVVSPTITLADVRRIAARVRRPII